MGEYERKQMNQLSRAITNGESRSKQLKGFVDNRDVIKRQSLFINTIGCRPIQRYVVNVAYPAAGSARALIDSPVGVAGPSLTPHITQNSHLIAHRFGGQPGGSNIVELPIAANVAMTGPETTVYNYMNAHLGSRILYTSTSVGYNALNNQAASVNVHAWDTTLGGQIV